MVTVDGSHLLRVLASLSILEQVRDFVEKVGAALGGEPAAVEALRLAVDEAVTNVIRHGYRNQTGPIEIEITRAGADLVVYLRDEAPLFDPTTLPPPDLTRPLVERALGGLGVYLIRRSTDEFTHRPRPGGGNELTLVKRGVFMEE